MDCVDKDMEDDRYKILQFCLQYLNEHPFANIANF